MGAIGNLQTAKADSGERCTGSCAASSCFPNARLSQIISTSISAPRLEPLCIRRQRSLSRETAASNRLAGALACRRLPALGRLRANGRAAHLLRQPHQPHGHDRAAALPRSLRANTRPVAAKDYWDRAGIRRTIAKEELNVVMIDRSRADPDADPLDPLRDALEHGFSLIIFPEGTRAAQALPGEFKSGLYHLASAFPAVELIPVYIENLHQACRRARSCRCRSSALCASVLHSSYASARTRMNFCGARATRSLNWRISTHGPDAQRNVPRGLLRDGHSVDHCDRGRAMGRVAHDGHSAPGGWRSSTRACDRHGRYLRCLPSRS